MEQYNTILKQQEKRHAKKLLSKHGLVCKQLEYGDCEPLYIAKPYWTNRFDPNRESTVGVFCAIWVSNKLLEKNQFAYNIHAKTLSKWPGYKLTPRKFADEFRARVSSSVADWPGIRLDYGPSTLLEGRETNNLNNFSENVEKRIFGFTEIYQHIDEMLEHGRI